MVNTVGLTTYSELKSVILARGSAPAGPGRGPAGHLVWYGMNRLGSGNLEEAIFEKKNTKNGSNFQGEGILILKCFEQRLAYNNEVLVVNINFLGGS